VGAEDTFALDIFELGPAMAELAPLAAKVWRYCEGREILGKTVTLKIKYADFQIITRSRTVHGPVRDEHELLDIARALLEATFPTPKGIRLLGITLSSLLTVENEPQLSLPL
jgi:DNA polymerase-4